MKLSMLDQIVVLLLNASTSISLLAIASLGIAVTVGLMGIINFAHGELVMIGAYTVAVLTQAKVPLVLAMLAAPIVSGLVGWLVERSIVRWLYGRPLDTLLATAGLSMFLIQLVTLIFGADTRSVQIPGGSVTVGNHPVPVYRLLMILFAVFLSAFTYLVFARTRFGLEARASALNPSMAAAVGINIAQVNMWTFVFGSALAGIAGAILAPFISVTPTMSSVFIARAFMIVIVGGPAVLTGTSLSAAALGSVESAVALATTPMFGQIALLIWAVVLLRVFPRGISGSWKKSL